MAAMRAIWSKLWSRGITITITGSWPDASGDLCQKCGKARKFHRRGDDHKFVEKEDS